MSGGRRLSYGELDVQSDRLAAALSSRGVRRGDRIVVFMENCWEAVIGIFAALKAGAVFCPVNASTKPEKLAYLLNHCRAAAVVTQARLLPVATAALAHAPSVALTIGSEQSSTRMMSCPLATCSPGATSVSQIRPLAGSGMTASARWR